MIPIPEFLKEPMRLYREGEAPLPRNYVTLHQKLADLDLQERLKSDDPDWVLVKDHGLVPDSASCDGMHYREIIVAVRTDTDWGGTPEETWATHTLRWHESGAWFIKGAGWSRFVEIKPHVYQTVIDAWLLKFSTTATKN